MRLKFIYLAFVFLFLSSCNKDRVYDEFDSNFENNRWKETDVRIFEFENKLEESLDLKLHFGHIRGFQFREIPLEVEITTPDNKKEIIPVNLKLIDETGKDLGDCTGDICDVFQTIKTFDTLQSGKYIVTVKSKFAGPYLPNVLGVGITVEKRL